MARIVRISKSSLRATWFTALVICQTAACGSSVTPTAGQVQRSDAGPAGIVDAGPAGVVDGATAQDGSGRTYPSSNPETIPLFDEGTIVDFYVTFSDDAWNDLLTLTGDNDTRWVPCTFTALGEPVVSAECRRKGDMGGWVYEKKPQFIVAFNQTDKDARFRGLKRFNLEAFPGAAAPIRDRIGMWVMRQAGIDAPRVNHVRVFKNGEILGLYMNIEAEDKEFLKDHFGPTADDGNLWESGYELKTNEDVNDTSRIDALGSLIDSEPLTGDHTAFFGQLAMRMDVSQVLREMAAETAILTNDNFSQGSTNFDYYEHPTRGFIVFPWDLDSIITQGPVDADLYDFKGDSSGSKLRELMNQNPTWMAQYNDDLVDIRDNVMTRVPDLVDGICTQIQGAFEEDPNRTSSPQDFQADCAKVRQAVIDRIAAMKTILGR
jgi:spore coat protein H